MREAWTAAIAERTPLAAADLVDGAVDVAWFRRRPRGAGRGGLGAGRQGRPLLLVLRRPQARPAVRRRHARRRHRGRARRRASQAKRHQDTRARARAAPARGRAALLRRYEALQQFARDSRQFGSMRQASEKRAAAIGLENLARSAGYDGPDAARLGDGGARPPTSTRSKPAELRRRRGRIRASLEEAMVRGDELHRAPSSPSSPRTRCCGRCSSGSSSSTRTGGLAWAGGRRAASGCGSRTRSTCSAADWPAWQRECLERRVAQPFKQVFRELYLPTRDEREAREGSARYAGHQIQPGKALALLGGRGWVNHREDGLRRTFHDARVTASLWVENGYLTPAEVEPPAIELVVFTPLGEWTPIAARRRPAARVQRGDARPRPRRLRRPRRRRRPRGERLDGRDARRPGRETCALLGIENVRVEGTQALIDGELGEYSVHLGSARRAPAPGRRRLHRPRHAPAARPPVPALRRRRPAHRRGARQGAAARSGYPDQGSGHTRAAALVNETVFTLEATPIKFGPGAAADAGWELKRLGVARALLVTDPGVAATGHPDRVRESIEAEGIEVVVYDRGPRRADARLAPGTRPTPRCEAKVDGFVSVGGGSAIDTAKVANLVVTHPAPVMDYVNAPIGEGRKPPAPLQPHLAIPTTSGTGSEATTVAVLDIPDLKVKTGISHRYLRPAQAIVDPDLTRTLPAEVTASAGLDVVCHAAESYLSKPFDARAPARVARRPPALPGRQPGRRRVVGQGARVRRRLPAPRGGGRRGRRGARPHDARRLDGRRRLRLRRRPHPARVRVSDRRASSTSTSRPATPTTTRSSRTGTRDRHRAGRVPLHLRRRRPSATTTSPSCSTASRSRIPGRTRCPRCCGR